MSFDISTEAVADTNTIEILDKATGMPKMGIGSDGQPAPMSVTTYAPGTKEFVAASTRNQNRSMKRLRQRGGKADQTPEESVASTAQLLSEITISFNNFHYKGLEGPAQFRACYEDVGLGWLTIQVNEGAGDWGNGTTPTSQPT